jgi:hypothetical protein
MVPGPESEIGAERLGEKKEYENHGIKSLKSNSFLLETTGYTGNFLY